MKSSSTKSGCHSADVQMHLCLGGNVLPIAQLGPDFLVLRTPIDHAPDVGEIDMSVDGSRSRWFVHLPDGLAAERRKTRIAPWEPRNGTTVCESSQIKKS
jgi:hypothetical protein